MFFSYRTGGPALTWAAAALVLVAVRGVGANPREVVVVANRNVPESVELAGYYAEARGLPAEHLCLVDLPAGEVMSRRDFEQRLRDPLLAFLRRTGLVEQVSRPADEVGAHETGWETRASSLRYLVCMYGVPLRIADTKFDIVAKLADQVGRPEFKNTAAVDSELALLLCAPYGIGSAQASPYYGVLSRGQLSAPASYFLLAARLDGPTPEVVRRMIDDALAAEKYGLQGRAYFDASQHQDQYALGDYWIEESYHRFVREGYEGVLERTAAMWGDAYPMEDAAVYLGWYAEHAVGPFTREDFTFRQGAVAYHIHSASARTLRETARQWAGPLLHKGAAVTMGAVNEPYLTFTPHLHIFSDRLCSGYSFGEAAYMALSHVSWQVTVVGDPLYRPFALSLDDQVRNLKADGRKELEWALVRKANRLLQRGRFNLAVELCREQAELLDSHVLREKLADIYWANEQFDEAGHLYEALLDNAPTAATVARVGHRWLTYLRSAGQEDRAQERAEMLRKRWPDSRMLAGLDVVTVDGPSRPEK